MQSTWEACIASACCLSSVLPTLRAVTACVLSKLHWPKRLLQTSTAQKNFLQEGSCTEASTWYCESIGFSRGVVMQNRLVVQKMMRS